jgi:hypothetical protein
MAHLTQAPYKNSTADQLKLHPNIPLQINPNVSANLTPAPTLTAATKYSSQFHAGSIQIF